MSFPGPDCQPAGCRILIVDDDPLNRELLRDALAADGYRMWEASDGLEALEKIAEAEPDVVLLDVLMPGLDGLEVCRRTTSDDKSRHIPVLLITSQSGRRERLEGIAAGATDFINKPVDIPDLRLRVKNAIRTKRLYDQVHEKYEQVAALEKLRDELVHMIVHDMKTPLCCMVGNLEALQADGAKALDPDDRECIDWAVQSGTTLTRMIDAMLDVSRLESGQLPLKLQAVDLTRLVSDTVGSFHWDAQRSRLEIENSVEDIQARCDADLVSRVVANLLSNALDYSPPDAPVILRTERLDGQARFSITDGGLGIPEEYRSKIFEKFGQIEGRKKGRKVSTGLGLAFCKLAIEAHGGTIGVDSEPGRGSTFWFELPCES